MSKTDFFSDDLSDLLDSTAPVQQQQPKQLPEHLANIREQGIGEQPAAKLFKVPCRACGGSGVWRGAWKTGTCFTCKGKGHFERKQSAQTLATNRAKAAERKVRNAQENWDAFVKDHPALAQVLIKGINNLRNERWSDICSEIAGKVRKYGDLHQGTMDMLQRSADRDAQWEAERKARAEQQVQAIAPVTIDLGGIVELFVKAREAGLKRFNLRFIGAQFEQDKNKADLIWVSESGYGSAKYGVIERGVYKPGRAVTKDVLDRLVEISQDPLKHGIAYAQKTSSCSVCGRHLENQDSVDAGIGPICAGRLNRPGLKFEKVELA